MELNGYGVFAGVDLSRAWSEHHASGDFARLPVEVVMLVLSACTLRSLCLLCDASKVLRALIYRAELLRKAFASEYPLLSLLFAKHPHIAGIRSGRLAFKVLTSPLVAVQGQPHGPTMISGEHFRVIQAFRVMTNPRVTESLLRFLNDAIETNPQLANTLLALDVLAVLAQRSSVISTYGLNAQEFHSVMANYTLSFKCWSDAPDFRVLMAESPGLASKLARELVDLMRNFAALSDAVLYNEALYALIGAIVFSANAKDQTVNKQMWQHLDKDFRPDAQPRGVGRRSFSLEDLCGNLFLSVQLAAGRPQYSSEERVLLYVVSSLVRFEGNTDVFQNVTSFLVAYTTTLDVWCTLLRAGCPAILLSAISKLIERLQTGADDVNLEAVVDSLPKAGRLYVIFLNGSGLKPVLLTGEGTTDDAEAAKHVRPMVEDNCCQLRAVIEQTCALVQQRSLGDELAVALLRSLLFALVSYANVASISTLRASLDTVRSVVTLLRGHLRDAEDADEVADMITGTIAALVKEQLRLKAPSERRLCYDHYLKKSGAGS